MKRYCVKCETDRVEFLDVLRETEEGYMVRVIRVKDGYDKVVEEFMSRHLFELCLHTGFIYEFIYEMKEESASSVA